MKDIRYTKSRGVPHGSMEDEFLCHRKGPEWWYSTGYLNDKAGNFFTYQFTLAKIRIYGITFNILMTAVTDFQTGKHNYNQQAIFFGRNVVITPERIALDGTAEMTFTGKQIGLNIAGDNYSLQLDMQAAKQPVWHCEEGVLKMGIDNQFTYYYSYTNLPAAGMLKIDGREYRVIGKGWFDRQGGPYNPVDPRTSWEWFSLRWFDNEEAMLFSFPQDNYHDGTFINKSGAYRRFNEYKITTLDWTEAKGKKFSCGWRVEMKGVKDEEYTITPKIDGQLNLFYFELLADIKDRNGKVVGYCMVELLPGVYNKQTPLDAFARA